MATSGDRRRPPAVRPHCGRRQQERRAAAAGRVPADVGDLRDSQRAAHPRRRRDDRLLRSLGAEVEGDGTTTLRVTCRDITLVRAGRRAGRASCADRCCCSARCSARVGRAELAPPGGDFPARRTITTHLRALARAGRARRRRPRPATGSKRPTGLTGASMYLLEASVTGTETALLAAAQAAGATEIRQRRLRAARRRAVPVPGGDGRRRHGHRHVDDSHRAAGRLARRDAHAARRLHRGRRRGRVVGAVTGGEVEVTGAHAAGPRADRRRARRRWAWTCDLDRRPVRRAAVAPRRRAPHHDRPLARVSRATS